MASKYAQVTQAFESLKQTLVDMVESNGLTDDELSELNAKEIECLIEKRNVICNNFPYLQKQKIEDDFKKRYLNLTHFDNNFRRVESILQWGLNKDTSFVNNVQKYKDHIVDFLSTLKEDDTDVFKTIWDCIMQNKLLLNKSDVDRIITNKKLFLSYCVSSSLCKPDNDDNDQPNIEMSAAESFLVSALMTMTDFDNDTKLIKKIFTKYRNVCHPKLQVFPMKITRFQGELIEQISNHYESKNVSISPIVNYKRTVGVVLNNKPSEYYRYRDVFTNDQVAKHMIVKHIGIEFPYMCYIRVSHMEFDMCSECSEIMNNKTMSLEKLEAVVGRDYNVKMNEFYNYKGNNDVINENENVSVVNVKCTNPNTVGHYVYTFFSLFGTYMQLRNIRVYGEAISFA